MDDYGVTQRIQSMNNYRPRLNILHCTGKEDFSLETGTYS